MLRALASDLRPRRRRLTVRAKLVVLVALLLGGIVTSILAYFPARWQGLILRSVETEAAALAQMAAFSVEPALVFGDRRSALEALGGVRQNRRLAYLVVATAEGEVFAALDLAAAQRLSFRAQEAHDPRLEVFRKSVPIVHRGERLGTLHLGLSLVELREEIRRMRALIAMVSVVLFVIGLGYALAVGAYLTRPLQQVVAAATDIARGDRTRRAPVTSGDELGDLAAAFNLMVDRLDGARRDLEQLNADLATGSRQMAEEVAQRRRSEGELQSSNERFALAASAVDGVVYDRDLAADHAVWSDGLQRVFGYDPSEPTGSMQWWERHVHPQERPRVVAQFGAALSAGSDFFAEYRLRAAGGDYVSVRDRGRFLRNGGGRPGRMVGIIENVTELKRLEHQFQQAQKLEGLGRLAGGVAHDFNNLLTSVLGYADLLLATLPGDGGWREQVEEIRKAGQRAAGLTRQLLAFSRKQTIEPRVLDLNTTVATMEKMLRRLIGEDVELVTELDSQAGRILADPTQMEQILLNVAVNARDAMPQGGRLTIRTAPRRFAAPDPRSGAGPGHYVLLALGDTGCGMDEATRARMFEPFFTTKEPGKGTGLGMATVYGIVQGAGGHVWVESEPGMGTTVNVLLPQTAASGTAAAPEAALALPPAHATILLVEDEEGVRSLVHTLLTAQGHRVLEADRPLVALALAETPGTHIDLLLTDVVMPEMNGRQLADRLAATHPDMRVVFMSGYLDDVILRHGLDDAEVVLVEKPFTPRGLLEKLHQALDSPAAAPATPSAALARVG